jgi:hypothetical protein
VLRPLGRVCDPAARGGRAAGAASSSSVLVLHGGPVGGAARWPARGLCSGGQRMVSGGRRGGQRHRTCALDLELERSGGAAASGGLGRRRARPRVARAAAAGMVAVGWPDRMADFFSGDVVR